MINIPLEIVNPSGDVQIVVLEQNVAMVGSDSSCAICLDWEGMVKGQFAVVSISDDGKVTLTPLPGQESIYLNGQKVAAPVAIEEDDQIKIGEFIIRMEPIPTRIVKAPPGIQDEEVTQPVKEDDDDITKMVDISPAVSISEGFAPPVAAAGFARVDDEEYQPPVTYQELFSKQLGDTDFPSASERVLEFSIFWGPSTLSVDHIQPKTMSKDFTIGDSELADFRMQSDKVGEKLFPVLGNKNGELNLSFNQQMDFHVKRGEQVYDRDALLKANLIDKQQDIFSYTIGLNDFCTIQVGDILFSGRYMKPGKIKKVTFLEKLDIYLGKILFLSILGHILFLIALMITPSDIHKLREDLFATPDRFAKLIIKAPEKKKLAKRFKKLAEKKEEEKKETDFGKEKPKVTEDKKVKAVKVDINKREKDRKKALKSGILGLLKSGQGGAMSNIFGSGGLGTGINVAMGNLKGEESDAAGLAGLGTRGSGPGGVGGGLGIGGLGTYGRAGGSGGYGSINLGSRGKGFLRLNPGASVVRGSLSKEVIGKVIRRHLKEIKYCYEKELSKNPNLYGKVLVKFVISGTGIVTSARVKETSMNNRSVESCMLSRVRRWRFPQPRGGGSVYVTYPFVFKSAG